MINGTRPRAFHRNPLRRTCACVRGQHERIDVRPHRLHYVRGQALSLRFVRMEECKPAIEPARDQPDSRLTLQQRVKVIENRVQRIGGIARSQR